MSAAEIERLGAVVVQVGTLTRDDPEEWTWFDGAVAARELSSRGVRVVPVGPRLWRVRTEDHAAQEDRS